MNQIRASCFLMDGTASSSAELMDAVSDPTRAFSGVALIISMFIPLFWRWRGSMEHSRAFMARMALSSIIRIAVYASIVTRHDDPNSYELALGMIIVEAGILASLLVKMLRGRLLIDHRILRVMMLLDILLVAELGHRLLTTAINFDLESLFTLYLQLSFRGVFALLFVITALLDAIFAIKRDHGAPSD